MLSYKSYNFNLKLNYIFNNMEHQTLIMLVVVCVTMIAFVEVMQQTIGGPCYTFLRLDKKTYHTKFNLKMSICKGYNGGG
jgi:hypothetical protein